MQPTMKKTLCLLIALLPLHVAAGESLQLENRMLFPQPELARAGTCVNYREGGAGWLLTQPVYWLRGETVSARVEKRKIARCPESAGKLPQNYSREEFVRLLRAKPCQAQASTDNGSEIDIGVIRVRITDWETPWARREASAGRLYRGQYLDQPLQRSQEIDIDADLLSECATGTN